MGQKRRRQSHALRESPSRGLYSPFPHPRPKSGKHARQPHKMSRQNSTVHRFRLKPSNQKITPEQGPRPGPHYSPKDRGATPRWTKKPPATVKRNAKTGILANGIKKSKGNHDSKTWEAAHRRHLIQAYQLTINHLRNT